jgi:membrane protein DedA with SNARE-associated domain
LLDQYMAQAAEFIQTHHMWAGPLLALATFGESLVVIGFLIPATGLLLVAGALVGQGILEPGPLFLWLVAGAVVGDAVSFWLGRWAGPTLIQRWPLNKHRKAAARARLFFMRYGFLSIFIGRFLGPVRSTIPLVAGMMRMRQLSFQLANASSAVVWIAAILAPGYLAARGASAAGMAGGEQAVTMILLIVVLSAIGGLIGARFLRSATKRRAAAAQAHDKPRLPG